jgi:hypothetical protein
MIKAWRIDQDESPSAVTGIDHRNTDYICSARANPVADKCNVVVRNGVDELKMGVIK